MIEFFAGAVAAFVGLFGFGAPTTATVSPEVQPTTAIVVLQDTEELAISDLSAAPTTIINQYITQPATGRLLPAQDAVTRDEFDTKLGQFENKLTSLIYGWTVRQSGTPASPIADSIAAGGVWNAIAGTNKIDQLTNVNISNATITGVTGLTNADIPDDITASNYLPLSGGSLAFASSTLFSVFNGAYFGATATSSFDSTGALTLALRLALEVAVLGGLRLRAVIPRSETDHPDLPQVRVFIGTT